MTNTYMAEYINKTNPVCIICICSLLVFSARQVNLPLSPMHFIQYISRLNRKENLQNISRFISMETSKIITTKSLLLPAEMSINLTQTALRQEG